MATIKVRNVDALGEYRLALEFSDGTSGVANLSQHVERIPFKALKNETIFRGARVEHGAVEWPGAEVGIATEALYALVHGLPKPTTLPEAMDNELTVSLRELRKALGKTQTELATVVGLTQGALSQFENSRDHKLSALRKHLASLGAELEVTAVVGSRRFTLHGV